MGCRDSGQRDAGIRGCRAGGDIEARGPRNAGMWRCRGDRDPGLQRSKAGAAGTQGWKGPRAAGTQTQGFRTQRCRDPGLRGCRAGGDTEARGPRDAGTRGWRDPWGQIKQGHRDTGTQSRTEMGTQSLQGRRARPPPPTLPQTDARGQLCPFPDTPLTPSRPQQSARSAHPPLSTGAHWGRSGTRGRTALAQPGRWMR